MSETANLYVLCGLIGSGKTTYAHNTFNKKSIIFTMDEWIIDLFGEHMEREVFDNKIYTLESKFKQLALNLINNNINVVFDFGYWKKSHRDSIRQWAKDNNIPIHMIYFDTSAKESLKRAKKRNDNPNKKSFNITDDMFNTLLEIFDFPNTDEIFDTIIK